MRDINSFSMFYMSNNTIVINVHNSVDNFGIIYGVWSVNFKL